MGLTIKNKTISIRYEYTNEAVKVIGGYNTDGENNLTSLNGEVTYDTTMIGNFNGMVQPSGTIIYNQSDVPSDKLELFRSTVSAVETAIRAEINKEGGAE